MRKETDAEALFILRHLHLLLHLFPVECLPMSKIAEVS